MKSATRRAVPGIGSLLIAAMLAACGGSGQSPTAQAPAPTPVSSDPGAAPAPAADDGQWRGRKLALLGGPTGGDQTLWLVDPADRSTAVRVASPVGSISYALESDYRDETGAMGWWAMGPVYFESGGRLYVVDIKPGASTTPRQIPVDRRVCQVSMAKTTNAAGPIDGAGAETAVMHLLLANAAGSCSAFDWVHGFYDVARDRTTITDISWSDFFVLPVGTLLGNFTSTRRWLVAPQLSGGLRTGRAVPGVPGGRWISTDGSTITPIEGNTKAPEGFTPGAYYFLTGGELATVLPVDGNTVRTLSFRQAPGVSGLVIAEDFDSGYIEMSGGTSQEAIDQRGLYRVPLRGFGELERVYHPADSAGLTDFQVIGVTPDVIWTMQQRGTGTAKNLLAYRRSTGRERILDTGPAETTARFEVLDHGRAGTLIRRRDLRAGSADPARLIVYGPQLDAVRTYPRAVWHYSMGQGFAPKGASVYPVSDGTWRAVLQVFPEAGGGTSTHLEALDLDTLQTTDLGRFARPPGQRVWMDSPDGWFIAGTYEAGYVSGQARQADSLLPLTLR